ncbi:GDSL-type esterase/lipase family protein [Pseudorhodobacter wandonensis]|uniref:GDSL-type esterase/lipase family protein n=1 Tax=Pseudorhodobacter wandonensis TaxID=1120568 RepID=UPI00067C9B70|nr:GDSL-type esterase/lipase family protein [Pseudorhodobacter wandonensis]
MRRTILVYGDSNTFGLKPLRFEGDIERFASYARWTSLLQVDLGSDFEVAVSGLCARTTIHDDTVEGNDRSGLRLLPTTMECHRPIDLLLIMLGTNDLKERFKLSPEDIAAGVEQLCLKARETGFLTTNLSCNLLIISPPVILETGVPADNFLGGAAKSLGLASAYADVAIRVGARFLNAADFIESDPLDGVHLSAAAHATLARKVSSVISPLLRKDPDTKEPENAAEART